MKNLPVYEKFAELVLRIGVNLKEGQGLELACPTEKREVAEAFTKVAYKIGAKLVRVRWEDEKIDKLNYEFASVDALSDIPKWFIDSKNYLVDNNFCYVAISSEDPTLFSNLDANKLAKVSRARSIKLKKFSDSVMANKIRWCVVSVPTLAWAEKVFPNSDDAERQLEDAIFKTMRLDTPNPLKAWAEHVEALDNRAEFLNGANFSYLQLKSNNGTDLKVGLCDNHKWLSAKEKDVNGVEFIANMPTEEVFTAPHKYKVDGRLVSALPLCYNGQIIDEFTIDFKKGKIVSFSAKKGYDTLKGLIETDKGTYRLGEVALIGKNSPIAKSNILFYNTLFDENASAHLAIGKGYPTTIINGENLTKSELKKLGLNDSVEHVDFMIGTHDLSVIGVTKSGEKVTLFSDGDWVI